MKSLAWIVGGVVLLAATVGTALYGQGGGGGGRGGEMPRFRMGLEDLGLSETELAATMKSVEAKLKLRQTLQEALGKLRRVADDPQATAEQLTSAVTAYTAALAKYRAEVQAEDSALAKQLSPRSQAQLLAAGIIDNGLAFTGRRPSGERGGAGGRGGEGGLGGEGGAGGAGGPPPPPPHE